jgi:photosystem II stability/assembly factor-like uncharacterized protein
MKKILTNYLVLILLVSCGQDEHWRTISPKGLDGQFNDILFINDSTGWIVGSKMELSLKNQDGLICKTVNGGQTWTPTFAGKGSFKFIRYVDDTLFSIKHIFKEDSYEEVNSVVAKSTDNGRTWKEISEIPGIVKQFSFSNSETGYSITKDNESNTNDWKLLKTSDAGTTWTQLNIFNNVQSGVFVDSIFFINQYQGTSLLTYDTQRETLYTEMFPSNFKSELITKDKNENVWIIGSNNGKFVLLKREGPNTFKEILFNQVKNGQPHDFYTYADIADNRIYLITGDGTSIVGVTHRFFKSEDLGKTWTEEEIPFNLTVEPICFTNGKIWSYDGTWLQVRDGGH